MKAAVDPAMEAQTSQCHCSQEPMSAGLVIELGVCILVGPQFFIEPYLQWWRPAGKSHEPASARSLLDKGDFNHPCHPAEGRNVFPMPQFNQDFPVMRKQRLLLPVWDRTPQLWHPPNWERSCLLQTSLCRVPRPSNFQSSR